MNGYELVSALIEAHVPDAAAELSDLLAEREERAARTKALEYELAWLVQYVRREGVNVVVKTSEGGEPIVWQREQGVFRGTTEQIVVVPGCPRLQEILDGKLPSLAAYREGRTP